MVLRRCCLPHLCGLITSCWWQEYCILRHHVELLRRKALACFYAILRIIIELFPRKLICTFFPVIASCSVFSHSSDIFLSSGIKLVHSFGKPSAQVTLILTCLSRLRGEKQILIHTMSSQPYLDYTAHCPLPFTVQQISDNQSILRLWTVSALLILQGALSYAGVCCLNVHLVSSFCHRWPNRLSTVVSVLYGCQF